MRPLGGTGIDVPEIALGTWGLSGDGYGPCTPENARATIEAAIDAGSTFIDTAPAYGRGVMETLIGDVLESRGRRAALVCVRIGLEREEGANAARKNFEPDGITAQVEASLKRLRTDHVDAFALHKPLVSTMKRAEPIEALRALKSSGKARTVGVSAGSADVARIALKLGVDFVMIPYNLLYPRLAHVISGELLNTNAGLIVHSPLAYGLLAGTWAADRAFGDDDHRRNRWTQAEIARRIRQREAARFIVHDSVKTLADGALRFVLANRMVSTAVVGSRTPEQARQNAGAAPELPYMQDQDLGTLSTRMQEEGIEF